jgi:ribosomal protein S3
VAAGIGGILDALFGSVRPPAGVSLLIAPECVGAIIGKAGATIKALRASSGAEIKASRSPPLSTRLICYPILEE